MRRPSQLDEKCSGIGSSVWSIQDLVVANGIELKPSRVEAHKSIGICECYQAPLRRIYRKLRNAYPTLDKRLFWDWPDEWRHGARRVAVIIVLEVIPSLPGNSNASTTQKERTASLALSRVEMGTITAEVKIAQALRSKFSPATHYDFKPSDDVRVYKEKEKRWSGPVMVMQTSSRQVTVADGTTVKTFRISQFIPTQANSHNRNLKRFWSGLNKLMKGCIPGFMMTEVIDVFDSRAAQVHFINRMRREIYELQRRKCFEIIKYDELDKSANFQSSCFVLTLKSTGTPNKHAKATLVAQGHRDVEKPCIIRDSTTLKQCSLSLILTLASITGYRLWLQDVDQAFIKNAELL